MADGRLWFNTKIDNSQVDKDLKQLEKKIKQAEASISKNENAKIPLEDNLKRMNKALEEAEQKAYRAKLMLDELKERQEFSEGVLANATTETYNEKYAVDIGKFLEIKEGKEELDRQVAEQLKSYEAAQNEVSRLKNEWSSVKEKVQGYDRAILQANTDIERCKEKAAQLTAQANSVGTRLSAAFAKARASAEKFRKQILRVGASMIMFRVFSAVFQGISTYMSKALKTNKEYTAQLAKLKAALLTAFQPVYEFVVPALVSLMKILSSVVQTIGRFFAAISGKSYAQLSKNAEALYKEADAIDGVGSAADKARKSLAGFDEINTLQESAGGSGSSVGTHESIAPDFSWLDETSDSFKEIEKLVGAISVGLLAWKISGSFLGGLTTALATIAAINIAVDWENISDVFSGWGDMIVGLFTVDVNRIKEGFDRAWLGFLNSEFMSTNIASLIMEWFGFDYEAAKKELLSYIGEGGSMWNLFSVAFYNFFDGVFGPVDDWWREKIYDPVVRHFTKLSQATELLWGTIGNIINGELDEVVKTWSPVAGWFFENVIVPVSRFFMNLFGVDIPDKAAEAADGAKSPFRSLGEYLVKVFSEAWKEVVAIFSDSGEFDIAEGIAESFISIVNRLIDGINKVIFNPFDKINTVLQTIKKVKIFGTTPFASLGTISYPKIPYLAQGAVLPPNKPFMAVVGDQKHGTNIEAPLATIQEAVQLVMNDHISAMMAGFEALLEENRALRQTVEGIEVGDSVIGQAAARYNRKMAVVKGGI